MYKYKCELCHHTDEFLLCSKCVDNYLNRSFQFKQSIVKEKNILQQTIQDLLLNKNYKKLMDYNNKKNLEIKIIKRLKQMEKIDQNITDKTNKIKEIKEIINIKKNTLKNNSLLILDTEIIKRVLPPIDNLKKNYMIKLANIIFNYNTIEISNYLEIQTYVKPNIIQSTIEMNFENLPNVLSSHIDIKSEDILIGYDKFLNIKSDVLTNQHSMNKLTGFIYKVIFFQESFSRLFHMCLPYEINGLSILNKFIDKSYSLQYTKYMKENELHDLIQGYLYLDRNLKYIYNYIKIREIKQRRRSSFELKDFLDMTGFISGESHQLIRQESDSNDFVVIDNYFI
jgi:hypothetical protein